jgi:hypothetical protein
MAFSAGDSMPLPSTSAIAGPMQSQSWRDGHYYPPAGISLERTWRSLAAQHQLSSPFGGSLSGLSKRTIHVRKAVAWLTAQNNFEVMAPVTGTQKRHNYAFMIMEGR